MRNRETVRRETTSIRRFIAKNAGFWDSLLPGERQEYLDLRVEENIVTSLNPNYDYGGLLAKLEDWNARVNRFDRDGWSKALSNYYAQIAAKQVSNVDGSRE